MRIIPGMGRLGCILNQMDEMTQGLERPGEQIDALHLIVGGQGLVKCPSCVLPRKTVACRLKSRPLSHRSDEWL